MIKTKLNKKKISQIFVLKIIFFIILIILCIIFFYNFYNIKTLNKNFLNLVEKFSQNHDFTLTKIKINKLSNIDSLIIEEYFSKYYNKSIFIF